ncbi:uncharacterized protein [Pithys albifrons albifrons]|uniref:uncharacterized protein n=1 Tax=Pithys albifrons albifrons TaxID=3385563 RepID=UPI003A5CED38
MAGPAEPSRAAAPSAATRGTPRRVLECAAVPGRVRQAASARERGRPSAGIEPALRQRERGRYSARAEYRAPSLLRTRGVRNFVATAHARSTARFVATAHARSTQRRRYCAGAEYEALSPVLPLLLDATSRVRSWRCFPAPAAAGAAGARGEHPAAGAAAPEAFLERGAGTIARSAAAKIPGVLGGFLKLIALKASDPQGFDLLNSIMEHMPPESVDWYRKQVFILLFQRLPSSKPTKLIKKNDDS